MPTEASQGVRLADENCILRRGVNLNVFSPSDLDMIGVAERGAGRTMMADRHEALEGAMVDKSTVDTSTTRCACLPNDVPSAMAS